MNRFTCLLALLFCFFYYYCFSGSPVSFITLFHKNLGFCRVLVRLYGQAPVESCHGTRSNPLALVLVP